MSDAERVQPLGQVLQAAIDDALAQWAQEHARALEPDEWLADELVGYTVTFSYWRRKPNYCWIEVTAKRPWNSATYGFRVLALSRNKANSTVQRLT